VRKSPGTDILAWVIVIMIGIIVMSLLGSGVVGATRLLWRTITG
jgi:hypothetical protein